jgi:CheY-like chemotaxis protein
MQTSTMRVINNHVFRFLNRTLPVLVFLCATQAVAAQATVSISPSVVLVLKLISDTHVKPTTGIVISDTGLVLVSAEFVSSPGEMIVLDGGTDILSNGRPASLLAEVDSGNLAVISVEGLTRPGIILSDNVLNTESSLHLEAFPPAEYIAEGAPPLWVPLALLSAEQGSEVSISSETPLPFVSGAIVDHCGYLAGISISSGPQSLDSGTSPLTIFNKEISNAFEAMQLTVPTGSCQRLMQASEAPVIPTDSIDDNTATTETEEQTTATEALESVEREIPDAIVSDDSTPTSQGAATNRIDEKKQAITSVPEPRSIWRSVPLWLPLIGAIILGVLAWKAIFFFRLNRQEPGREAGSRIAYGVQSASDEPVTAPLQTEANENLVKPRSAPVLDLEIPELSARPDGCDGVLLVEGVLDAEISFKRFCFVNTEQINVIIGRGGTDIAIEHAAISRAHLRVESDGELITLSDLGSKNGTFIGDVPCLPGEIMYLGADDEIYLGDVKLTIRVVKQEAGWA